MNQIMKKVSNNNSDFLDLCKKLDDVHNEIVAEQRKVKANCLNGLDKFSDVYIVYINKEPAGCLALTDVIDGIIEIGRVFVCDNYRNQGIATKLLIKAEEIARNKGANTLILDTYERLIDAINLYKRFGFKIVPQFLELKDSPFSICMAKELK